MDRGSAQLYRVPKLSFRFGDQFDLIFGTLSSFELPPTRPLGYFR